MGAHFVTVFDDHFHFLGESLQRVAGNEERGLQIVFLEQAQQARHTHFGCEYAALDVRRGIPAAVRADPARDRVDVGAKGTIDLFSHEGVLLRCQIVGHFGSVSAMG